ncbi:MAG TPA: hypothetical protein VN026_10180 [Bacteroidia bacterium]|jgi:hypothetical protein|nr:hypothetical protein [Bacteroidia bacterium]
MQPLKSAEVFETATSQYWFDDALIMYVVTKKGTPPDLSAHKKDIEAFKKRIGNKKICAIMEINDSTPTSKEIRKFNTSELPDLFKAIAFIIKNPLMKMLATLYMGIKTTPFPVKMCSTEEEAKEWIKTQL